MFCILCNLPTICGNTLDDLARHYFQVIQPMRDRYFFRLRISRAGFVNPAVSVQRVYSMHIYANMLYPYAGIPSLCGGNISADQEKVHWC